MSRSVPLDLDALLGGEALARLLRLGEHRASVPASRWRWSSSCSAVSTTDVTMPGLADDAARRADGAAARAPRDVADLERELRRAGERVAALVHRRRAGVRGLAAPRDQRRSTPNVPSTAPSGRSSDSSTGPCSMCSSR